MKKKDYSLDKYIKLMQQFYDVLEPDCREMTQEQLNRLAAECRKVTGKTSSIVKFNAAKLILDWIGFEDALRTIASD